MQEQDYILFEDYISGKLSQEEITTFEGRLNRDTEFNKAFNTYKELSGFLEHEIGNEEASTSFKNNLKSISDSYFEDKTTSKKVIKFNFYKYAIAACVALFMGLFIFNQFSNPSYNDFSNHETIDLGVRGVNIGLLIQATEAFNESNYEEASKHLEELLKEDANNTELQLYYAITNVELDKFEKSDPSLMIISQGHSAYKNTATWYLALSKLKQKDLVTCNEILETIPEDADEHEQAQKLLNKLD